MNLALKLGAETPESILKTDRGFIARKNIFIINIKLKVNFCN